MFLALPSLSYTLTLTAAHCFAKQRSFSRKENYYNSLHAYTTKHKTTYWWLAIHYNTQMETTKQQQMSYFAAEQTTFIYFNIKT